MARCKKVQSAGTIWSNEDFDSLKPNTFYLADEAQFSSTIHVFKGWIESREQDKVAREADQHHFEVQWYYVV